MVLLQEGLLSPVACYDDAGLWLQKNNPTLFGQRDLLRRAKRNPLTLSDTRRTILHAVAVAEPSKAKHAIAFAYVSFYSEEVQRAGLESVSVMALISNSRDIYGWKPSDYLIARGAMESLLMLCVSFRLDHIPGKPLPPFDFSRFAACSDMFTGHVLKQVPPELSATVSDIDWPAAGKSPRQLALDLGHLEIVELMDFVQFHAEGSSLVSHLESTTTFVEGSFALAKSGASSFVQHVEAKSKFALKYSLDSANFLWDCPCRTAIFACYGSNVPAKYSNTHRMFCSTRAARTVETRYWIEKCCKMAFQAGAYEFSKWCTHSCPGDLRSALSPSSRRHLLWRLACGTYTSEHGKAHDRDIWSVEYKFRAEYAGITRAQVYECFKQMSADRSVAERNLFGSGSNRLDAYDAVRTVWFQQWDGSVSVLDAALLRKVILSREFNKTNYTDRRRDIEQSDRFNGS